MGHIRWIQQQDWCLRLGLLKTLVACLPPVRRSVGRAHILAQLDKALFQPLSSADEALRSAAVAAYGAPLPARKEPTGASKRKRLGPFVADALLFASPSNSWGQPIVPETLAKVLEWGQNAGLVGAGNQITERGVLLRSFFPPAADEVVRGATAAWNPFDITPAERAFFFYHLGELDEPLWLAAYAAGLKGSGREIGTGLAHVLTKDALQNVVDRAETAPLHERPLLLRLRELTSKIAHELDPENVPLQRRSYGPPPVPRRTSTPTDEKRQTTKSADHEAIPRFEILTDLGFVTKPSGGRERAKAMRGWTFVVTPSGHQFSAALQSRQVAPVGDWHWRHFGYAMASSNLVYGEASRTASAAEALQLFGRCYQAMHRQAGHTPFDTIAMRTVIAGLERGLTIEVVHLHSVLLHAKRTGGLDASISFAGANEIEKLFVRLRPSFEDDALTWLERAGLAKAPADRSMDDER